MAYPEGEAVRREINVLALVKGEERFIYIYDDASCQALSDAFRDHAADPRLSFSWFDAAVLKERAKDQARGGRSTACAPESRV